MNHIGKITHQVAILVARSQLTLEVSANPQPLFKHKNILGTTIYPLQKNCLPSNWIHKVFKSTNAAKGNLDEHFIPRRYSPEEDLKLLEHVKFYGKTANSLRDIANILDRTYNSVASRCRKLLSNNRFDAHTNRKVWGNEEDNRLVEYIFNLMEVETCNISIIVDAKESEFNDIAPEFGRSSQAVYMHWKRQIVPLLELHLDDLKTSKSLREDV